MKDDAKNKLDIFFQIITLIATIFPLYLFYVGGKEISLATWIILAIIMITALIGFAFSFIYDKYKTMLTDIEKNKKTIEEIKKDLDFKKIFDNFDIRLKILENLFNKRSKKGVFNIDPRLVIIILILILIYLYLKSLK